MKIKALENPEIHLPFRSSCRLCNHLPRNREVVLEEWYFLSDWTVAYKKKQKLKSISLDLDVLLCTARYNSPAFNRDTFYTLNDVKVKSDWAVVPKLSCDIDSVNLFNDLNVFTSAGIFAAASAAELHFRRIFVLYVFLLLLRHPQFLLHYRLNLKLKDLKKGKKYSLQKCRIRFKWWKIKRCKFNRPVCYSPLDLRL